MNCVISIIVPVYNVEEYLRECINSLLAQTFTDYELILVDDGSTDSSGRICDEYTAQDNRIKVIHQTNQGQSAARNAGVAASRCEWLCFVDSDDVVSPFFLECLFDAVKEYNSPMATCRRISGTDPGALNVTAKPDPKPIRFTVNEQFLIDLFNEKNTLYWTPFPCLVKKDIYLKHPLTPGRIMEDNAVACKWLYEAKTVAFTDHPLYYYRENPNGTMAAPFGKKKLDYLWAMEEQLRFYKAAGYDEMFGKIAAHYADTAVWYSKRAVRELVDKKLSIKILKDADSLLKSLDAYRFVKETDYDYIRKRTHRLIYRIRRRIIHA